VLDRVNRRDGYSTSEHALVANVYRVVSLEANSYLALVMCFPPVMRVVFLIAKSSSFAHPKWGRYNVFLIMFSLRFGSYSKSFW
jgi:hypothetical protein